MRYLLLYAFFFLFFRSLSAQKYDNVWMNGAFDHFYLDFENLSPSIYSVNTPYQFLSTLTFMSDVDGIPAFYSNGCSIYNASHEPMENGDSLLHDDYFCTLIGAMNYSHGSGVTLPGFSPQQYIMFSLSVGYPLVPNPCNNNRLVAHHIDMSVNQGKGKVTKKEELILNGCFQEPSANRHANGRDWWILLPDNQQGRFFRWLLTPTGLQGPWEQIIDNPTVKGSFYFGWSEFSPNGERYMINSAVTGIALYDFDRCTGLLSNPLFLEQENIHSGIGTFSPDSKLLYKSDSLLLKVIQYDLTAPDVNASQKVVAIWDGVMDTLGLVPSFGFMQQGPDGKLYVWAPQGYYMHVMDFPNRPGVACSLHQRAIRTLGISSSPNLYYPRYRLGPVDGSSCDTLGIDNHPTVLFRYDLEDTLFPLQVTFTDASSYLPTAWHWSFGDGTTSQDTNPIHNYTAPGLYTVCLIASNVYSADTFCCQVMVGTSSLHELPVLPQAKVLPNPFSNTVMIRLPAFVGVEPRFVLTDLYGRTIVCLQLNDFETPVTLSGLPDGIYVWQLFWNGVQTQHGKLIKVD